MTFRTPAALVQRLSFNDFHIIEQVGEGTYGRVFKARNIHTNKLTALKVVFPTDDDEGLPFTAVREIKYLQMLSDNPNVIKLEGTFFTRDGELVLAFEYMENDLSGLLSLKNHLFTPAQTKCLFKQVLEGLHQCHRAGIMHRDIKAANLLLSHGQLKLADFGLASNYVRRRTFSTNVVTLWYRAPELLLGGTAYGPKVDIWSAGCLLIELLTRQSPFPGREEKHQLELIVQTCGTPDERNWPGVTKLEGYKQLLGLMGHKNRLREVFGKFEPRALNLLSKMLALNPADRPTASEALDHDYFWTDPLPCKATELPHYPAMHEYEAKKTRQSERQPKRQRVASHTSVNVPIAPLRLQPHPSGRQHQQGYPTHIPLPVPQITRGDYPPYPSKPGLQYGQPPARQNPPVGMQGWGSATTHGAHPQVTSDGLLPTPHVPLPAPVHSSRSTGYMGTAYPGSLRPSAAASSTAQHHDALRSAVSQQPHATSGSMISARHSQSQRHRTSSAQSAAAMTSSVQPPSAHHRSQQAASLLATPSSSGGMSVRGGPYATARNGERYHDSLREMHRLPAPTSSRVPYTSLGGGPHMDDSSSSSSSSSLSYNRPPASAHRSYPHQHVQQQHHHHPQHQLRSGSSSLMHHHHQHDGHAPSAPYAVHTNMGHARAALSGASSGLLMHSMGGGSGHHHHHDVTTGKRKRAPHDVATAMAPLL